MNRFQYLLSISTYCSIVRPYGMMNMPHHRSPAAGSSNVLEVCFGKGSNSIYLRALKPEGVKFFAVDVVPAHVQYASKHAAAGPCTIPPFLA
jgi:tRNA G46 methylase TrmB